MEDQFIPESVHKGYAVSLVGVQYCKVPYSQVFNGISGNCFDLRGRGQEVSEKVNLEELSGSRMDWGKNFYLMVKKIQD